MTMAQDVQRHNTLLYQQKQFFWIKMISAAIAGYGSRSRARLALVAVLRQCDGSAKSLATERPAGCRSRIRARPALVAMLRQEAVLILAIPPGGDTELRQISCAPPREIRRRADLPQAIFGRPRQLFAHTSINSGSGINSANVLDPPKALPLSDPRGAGAASEPGRLWWQCSVEKLS